MTELIGSLVAIGLVVGGGLLVGLSWKVVVGVLMVLLGFALMGAIGNSSR